VAERSVLTQQVSESEIDWLICVELNCNPDFRQWLGEQILPSESVEHLVRGPTSTIAVGRIGFGVAGAHFQRRLAVLIENKISAGAQPRQYPRYLERGQQYISSGCCIHSKAWRSLRA
jgi:hypothetical protein